MSYNNWTYRSRNVFVFVFVFLWYWGLNSGPTLGPSPPAFLVNGFFRDRVLWTICLGWLQTAILLISASWVARITGVSHQHPARSRNLQGTNSFMSCGLTSVNPSGRGFLLASPHRCLQEVSPAWASRNNRSASGAWGVLDTLGHFNHSF
jgi:hypothetical protein